MLEVVGWLRVIISHIQGFTNGLALGNGSSQHLDPDQALKDLSRFSGTWDCGERRRVKM
jgi:hypothetical protein